MLRSVKILSFSFLFCGVLLSQPYDDNRADVIRDIELYVGDITNLIETDKNLVDILLNKILLGLDADVNSELYFQAIEVLSDYKTVNFLDRTTTVISNKSASEYKMIVSALYDYNRITGEYIIAENAKKMALNKVKNAIVTYFIVDLKIVPPAVFPNKTTPNIVIKTEVVGIPKATSFTEEKLQERIDHLGKEAFEYKNLKVRELMETFAFADVGLNYSDMDLVNAFVDKVLLNLSLDNPEDFNFVSGMLFNGDVMHFMEATGLELKSSSGLYIAYNKMIVAIKDYTLFERTSREGILKSPVFVELRDKKFREFTRSVRVYRAK